MAKVKIHEVTKPSSQLSLHLMWKLSSSPSQRETIGITSKMTYSYFGSTYPSRLTTKLSLLKTCQYYTPAKPSPYHQVLFSTNSVNEKTAKLSQLKTLPLQDLCRGSHGLHYHVSLNTRYSTKLGLPNHVPTPHATSIK